MTANSFAVDSELEASLGECKVGDTKQIMMTVEITGKDDSGLSGKIVGVEPYDTAEEAPETEAPSTGSKALKDALA